MEKIRHELSEEKLHKIFGETWKTLPDDVYKRLRFCPSSFIVEEHHVAVYAAVDGGKQEQVIVKADQPPEERHKMRQNILKPMVEAFFAWIRTNQPDVPPKSGTGKGFTYCLNQEKYLKAFLDDPEIPMDNNGA